MLLHARGLPSTVQQRVSDRPLPAGVLALRTAGRAARLAPAREHSMAALIQKLEQILGKRIVFFEATAKDTSFDEDWLFNLLDAVKQGDTDRYCFALRSRMKKIDAVDVHFLVCKVALTLDA